MNWLATLGNISVWTQNSLGNYSSFVVLRHSMHSQIFPTFFSRKCKPNVPFTFPSHSFFCLATILHTMAWSPSCHIYLLEAAWKQSQLAIKIRDEWRDALPLWKWCFSASSRHARHFCYLRLGCLQSLPLHVFSSPFQLSIKAVALSEDGTLLAAGGWSSEASPDGWKLDDHLGFQTIPEAWWVVKHFLK